MTTTIDTHAGTTTGASRAPLLAALGLAASAVLTAIGTFLGENTSGDESRDDVSTWLTCVGIAAVAAALVFGLVVRTAAHGHAGRRALITGILAVLSVAVFWAGLPMVLAAGALACALVDRDEQGSLGGAAGVGVALGGVAAAAAVVLAFVG